MITENAEFPKLILLDWQEGDDWLLRSKGWFCHNFVELANGNRYRVCFYDSVRLGQELKDNDQNGKPFFIEDALIVFYRRRANRFDRSNTRKHESSNYRSRKTKVF